MTDRREAEDRRRNAEVGKADRGITVTGEEPEKKLMDEKQRAFKGCFLF